MWQPRWHDEYRLAVNSNSSTRTVVPAKKDDLRVWKGYLKTQTGQLHSMEIRLEYQAETDKRTLFYPLAPPQVEWQTPIRHPNIQPPRPSGEGIVCLRPLRPELWNPKTHIFKVLDFIEVLLNSPDPSDPINHPVCLDVAVSMIKERLTRTPTLARILEPKLREAELVLRKYAQRWNAVRTDAEKRDRDRAWYLIVDAGKRLSAESGR